MHRTQWGWLAILLYSVPGVLACGTEVGADPGTRDAAAGVAPAAPDATAPAAETKPLLRDSANPPLASCRSPGDLQLQYLSTAWCADDSRTQAPDRDGCCGPSWSMVGDTTVVGALYRGVLPACDTAFLSSGGSVDIDVSGVVESVTASQDDAGLVHVVVSLKRTDVAQPCGVAFTVTAMRSRFTVEVGAPLRFRQRGSILGDQGDVPRFTSVISDDRAAPLLISSDGAFPPLLEPNLLPGIELEVDPHPLCDLGPNRWLALHRATLRDGADACALDPGTQKCCRIRGETMEVQLPGASGLVERSPQVRVNIALSRAGAFVPM